ncbi:GGDEF domain-containing protein [Deinococcus irradiatisoli]|uniref:GGDEF domain-containing protein n=1 Tax=Deinococcus irradiatisoli TaxID=2202254 RepID=A0A2Z3JFN6_9DEIO|nr:GGDEF domain-containing protein [Deinococcus irradiatisoli]
MLTLTLGLVALGLVTQLVLQALRWPAALGQVERWIPLAVVGLLLAVSRRRWPLEYSVTFSVLAFLPVALQDLHVALALGTLPTGLSVWAPAVIIEVFLLLGSSAGLLLVGLLGAPLLAGLLWRFPVLPSMQQAWINLVLTSLLLTWLGYNLSRFLERARRQQAQSDAALSEARQDALTRVLGRAAIEAELGLALDRAEVHNTPLSVLVCDIDHFKGINDHYGHAAGDQVLRAVARLLRRSVGQSGQVGRWGGEEFVLVVPLARNDALRLAERVRRDIEGTQVADHHVTVSLGVASYRSGERAAQVFARADQRLYEAKRHGRNLVR